MDLVGVHKENEQLRKEVNRLKTRLVFLSAQSAAADRLRSLLDFTPAEGWQRSGARVVAHDYASFGAVESIIIDKGKFQGFKTDMPVITPDGVVGRTFKTGLNFSSVLILTDPNSRIPVISSMTRVPGIIAGQGCGKSLSMQYVHLNSPLQEGEMLVTSGLAGIYPKGIPVARVNDIHRSEISLFLMVEASPLVSVKSSEEVLVLKKDDTLSRQTFLEE